MTHALKTTKNSGKIVFFGSGPVAARCLELLLIEWDIEAVVTKPRPIHHRGDVPVISLAESYSLPIFTASNRTELDHLFHTHTFVSQCAMLIDFGIIVSQKVINSFPLGIVNSHFSLLPHLRGADPITFSILEGAEKTGVSLMVLDEGMDTGKLLAYRSLHLASHETTPTLTERLIVLSDELINEYLPRYVAGKLVSKSQPHPERATYSRKLTKADGIIDWTQSAEQLEREIRAFYEWPKSRTTLGEIDVIIRSAKLEDAIADSQPGEYIYTDKQLLIQTGDGSLSIQHIQPLGKKEMPIQAFLAGYRSKL